MIPIISRTLVALFLSLVSTSDYSVDAVVSSNTSTGITSGRNVAASSPSGTTGDWRNVSPDDMFPDELEDLELDGMDPALFPSMSTITSTPRPARQNERTGHEKNFLVVERPLVNITKESGENLRMRCEFRGHPTPQIQWFKNEAPLEKEHGRIEIRLQVMDRGRVGSRLRMTHLDTHDTGYYKCEATNGIQTVETTGVVIVKAGYIQPPAAIPNFQPVSPHFPALGGGLPTFEEKINPLQEQAQCVPYKGKNCQEFIGNRTVYIPPRMTQEHLEVTLTATFTVFTSSPNVSPECHRYATLSLCFETFHLCDNTAVPLVPVARHMCRDECELLEKGLCKMEFAYSKRHPLIGGKMILPDCSSLAPITSEEGKDCVQLGVAKPVQNHGDNSCFNGNGEDYRGIVSESASGKKCRPWNQKLFPVSDYPELMGGHNHCRNPGGLESQPWCFVTDHKEVQKESCNIPKCPDYIWLYILLSAITGVTSIGVLIKICCTKRNSKPSSAPAKIPSSTENQKARQQPPELNALLPKPKVQLQEFPLTSIRFLQELCEGVYGKVYRGEVLGYQGMIGSIPVIIKTMARNTDPKKQQDFHREAEFVASLQHPHIVCLLGVNIQEEPMCMVFEYTCQGDLHEYLIMHSSRSDISAVSEDGSPKVLQMADFLHIASQIANGMEYLADHQFIHKDLAARNCLVGNNLMVKVSDLGVAKSTYAADYYRLPSNILIPVRWMPPESIVYNIFTTESDVWSFGVVLWEIFSCGLQPYFGYNNQEVVDMICSRQLLPSPQDCPSHIYAMMVECWHEVPSRRPSFKDIYRRLLSWQAMQFRTRRLSQSNSTHNGSHHSRSGPSNSTGTTVVDMSTIPTIPCPSTGSTTATNASITNNIGNCKVHPKVTMNFGIMPSHHPQVNPSYHHSDHSSIENSRPVTPVLRKLTQHPANNSGQPHV